MPRYLERAVAALRKFDGSDGVVKAARALRQRLPGDHSYGDPLSVAGDEPPQLIGQRLAAAGHERPSAARELGFGALQLWQAAAEAQGAGGAATGRSRSCSWTWCASRTGRSRRGTTRPSTCSGVWAGRSTRR